MNTAIKASSDLSLITFAVKTRVFSHCVIYDFADKSFLVVHDNGRVEPNSITV